MCSLSGKVTNFEPALKAELIRGRVFLGVEFVGVELIRGRWLGVEMSFVSLKK